MILIAIAWIYVVLLAAVAEAMSPGGTLLGALFTFVLYAVVPLAVVLYLVGTPARKRALRSAEQAGQALPETKGSSSSKAPDGSGHAPAGPVAAERKEP
jgi:membrane protein implicated in regulation of membrane protease activity